jgi:C4-type Zn-finger protein
MKINCPSCQKKFEIIDEEQNIKRQLACPHCLTHFEVTWLYPLTLDFIEEIPHIPNRPIESYVN